MRRAGLALLPLLLLLGCAAPPAAPEPPLPYPPSARERLLRVALAEWAEWGGITVAAGARPPSTRAESDPANFPRVLAYWRAVPEDEGAIALNRRRFAAALARQPGGEALWQDPYWSAAFISWLMQAAGVDRREFPPSAAHAAYVDALIRDAALFPATAPFLPRSPGEVPPQPGDLLCADRGRTPIQDWRQRAADAGRFRPMHCDIVVAAGPGWVDAIGGNVLDAVTRTRFPADASGYLLPAPPGAPVFFAILENRLGRLFPWRETTP
ncbi:DUF2272 domain-containing protein [Paracraurococcus ruber]|uniref:DUF2272 domain-containing protein n=1 Tax=Paracraurococcus ruber TaxID=77675 RepID=A0ABS1D1F5_9PROT|nr:DUF2272 domain-containing protein [Paracraurococcus ruber]MBK1660653.1 hypothetical protein [Paracraurococcus ruber]TDG19936.1 DUF2272 domain-containing protein [Paracraurococcus ruber]